MIKVANNDADEMPNTEANDGPTDEAESASEAANGQVRSDSSDGLTMPDVNVEPYEVFVQRQRGQSHEYAGTVNASDPELTLLFVKRNIDVRSEPVNIWLASRSAFHRTSPDDTTLVPHTD